MNRHLPGSPDMINQMAVQLLSIYTNRWNQGKIEKAIEWAEQVYAEELPLAELLDMMKARFPEMGDRLQHAINFTMATALAHDDNSRGQHMDALYAYLMVNPASRKEISAVTVHQANPPLREWKDLCYDIARPERAALCALLTRGHDQANAFIAQFLEGILQSENISRRLAETARLDPRFPERVRTQFIEQMIQKREYTLPLTPERRAAIQQIFTSEENSAQYASKILRDAFNLVCNPSGSELWNPHQINNAFDHIEFMQVRPNQPAITNAFLHLFKEIDRSYRREANDAAIRRTAPLLAQMLKRMDNVCHYWRTLLTHSLCSQSPEDNAMIDKAGKHKLLLAACLNIVAKPNNASHMDMAFSAAVISEATTEDILALYGHDSSALADIHAINPILELVTRMEPRHRRAALCVNMGL